MKHKSLVVLAAGVVLIAFACITCAIVMRAGDVALDAEGTYQAELIAVELICGFIEKDGRWPANWAELESIEVTNGAWDWPSEKNEIVSRAKINFEFEIKPFNGKTIERADVFETKPGVFVHDKTWLNELRRLGHQAGERKRNAIH